MGNPIKNKEVQRKALFRKNVVRNNNDKYLRLFNIIFNK